MSEPVIYCRAINMEYLPLMGFQRTMQEEKRLPGMATHSPSSTIIELREELPCGMYFLNIHFMLEI